MRSRGLVALHNPTNCDLVRPSKNSSIIVVCAVRCCARATLVSSVSAWRCAVHAHSPRKTHLITVARLGLIPVSHVRLYSLMKSLPRYDGSMTMCATVAGAGCCGSRAAVASALINY